VIFPFFGTTTTEDVLVVQINPLVRQATPTSASEIMNRINEITFNASLLEEYRAIEFVGRLIDQGKLPRGISGPVFNDDFGDTFGNIYALTGDGYSYPQLKTYAEELRNRIRALPQVAKVEFQGDQAERIFIVYQSQKLASLGISPQTLAQALSSNNSVVSAGQIVTADERIPLTVSGTLSSLEQIRNIGVATPDGRTVRLGDLAQVQRGLIDPIGRTFRFGIRKTID